MTGTDDARGGNADDDAEQMAAALAEIRREGWKAAVTSAVVEAGVLFLGVNLLLATLDLGWLPGPIAVPEAVTTAVGSAVGRELGTWAVPGSATVAAVVGLLGLAVGVRYRVRRPLVEQFEAVNPAVAEKLRTARDAVESDADSRMARRLYAEVLGDLRESSAIGLVEFRRLGIGACLLVVLSIATVQVAVVDIAIFDGPSPEETETTSDDPRKYTGLRDGEQVLGDREEVSAGDDNQTAEIESSGGGRDIDEDREFPTPASGGESGSNGIDSQQAEFAPSEQVEEAELVREYNRRIREQDAGDE